MQQCTMDLITYICSLQPKKPPCAQMEYFNYMNKYLQNIFKYILILLQTIIIIKNAVSE